jgi:protein involved in polysaccharide export with SLBB domain
MSANKNLLFVIVTVAALLAGCGTMQSRSFPKYSSSDRVGPYRPDTGHQEYVLQAGDVLEVKFFHMPELNEQLTIRPDGKISLQLVDEVQAAGLMPAELDAVLTKKYAGKLDNAELTVIVRTFAAYTVYVGGEVRAPGTIAFSGDLTVLQGILKAGGFKDTAELRNVVIIRNQGTMTPAFISVDLKQALVEDGVLNDIKLKPRDIVFLPKTGIAQVNQFVNQYINQIIPSALSMGLVYNLNPEVEVDQ